MTIVDSRPVLLANLIQGRRFDVPEIQRAYAFAIDNSDDAEANAAGATYLKNDLWSFHCKISETDRNYFLGSIIVQSDNGFDDPSEIFDLLDGQQRVTTLSLLFNEIYRQLVEDEVYEELALELKASWLDFDTDWYTEPQPGWTSCLYPRRESDRIAFQKAIQGSDLGDIPEGNIRDVVEDYRIFVSEFEDAKELAAFANTLLHRVEMMILCVPNTAMAFQMFQTANARGTPLSQLDMFRSTVVMQAQTTLQIDGEHINQLLGFLRHIEDTFIKKYEVEKVRGKKIDQLMKYWLWIRRGTDAGGVSYIMRMVEECLDHKTLVNLVFNLYQHVLVWCGTDEIQAIDESWSKIPNNNPLHPIFPKVTEGWKMFALAVGTARTFPRSERHLSARQEEMLLSLMTWWYLIEYSHNGTTNTTPFRSQWASLAHRTWHHSAHCSLEWNGWNNESFEAELDSKIGDFQFRQFPLLKGNSFSVNHSEAKSANVILGQFERCNKEGLRTQKGSEFMRQGSNTRDTTLIHLVPETYLPEHLANSIGNRTLVAGSAQGGIKVTELAKSFEQWGDAEDQLNGLIDTMSLASRTTKWPQNMNNPRELRIFIEHRNATIINTLNNALEQFKNQSFEI